MSKIVVLYIGTHFESSNELQLIRVLDGVKHELHVGGERAHAVKRRYQSDRDGTVRLHLAAEEEIAREVVRTEVVFAKRKCMF